MKIFVSFASPDRNVANGIQLALLGAGHEVFFDEASLPPGADYNSRIREAIKQCELFVFLISPNSVGQRRYAQAELKLAKMKWAKPWGFVLPVLISPTQSDLIDPYLTSVTMLTPVGNVPTEVAAAVENVPRHSPPSNPHVTGVRQRLWPLNRTRLSVAVGICAMAAMSIWWNKNLDEHTTYFAWPVVFKLGSALPVMMHAPGPPGALVPCVPRSISVMGVGPIVGLTGEQCAGHHIFVDQRLGSLRGGETVMLFALVRDASNATAEGGVQFATRISTNVPCTGALANGGYCFPSGSNSRVQFFRWAIVWSTATLPSEVIEVSARLNAYLPIERVPSSNGGERRVGEAPTN